MSVELLERGYKPATVVFDLQTARHSDRYLRETGFVMISENERWVWFVKENTNRLETYNATLVQIIEWTEPASRRLGRNVAVASLDGVHLKQS